MKKRFSMNRASISIFNRITSVRFMVDLSIDDRTCGIPVIKNERSTTRSSLADKYF